MKDLELGEWSARQLLQRFAVYGRFYERCVDGVTYPLRSLWKSLTAAWRGLRCARLRPIWWLS